MCGSCDKCHDRRLFKWCFVSVNFRRELFCELIIPSYNTHTNKSNITYSRFVINIHDNK